MKTRDERLIDADQDAPYLDDEEKELLEQFEAPGWAPVGNLSEWKAKLEDAARQTPTELPRINLHLAPSDFAGIKTRAAEIGVSYQILAENVLHRYVTGGLVER